MNRMNAWNVGYFNLKYKLEWLLLVQLIAARSGQMLLSFLFGDSATGADLNPGVSIEISHEFVILHLHGVDHKEVVHSGRNMF